MSILISERKKVLFLETCKVFSENKSNFLISEHSLISEHAGLADRLKREYTNYFSYFSNYVYAVTITSVHDPLGDGNEFYSFKANINRVLKAGNFSTNRSLCAKS